MGAAHGDLSFVIPVVKTQWTRGVPSPADPTVPKSAGRRLMLQNGGGGTVYGIKRLHDAAGDPTPALPAATEAAALADPGLRVVVEHGQQIPLGAGGNSQSLIIADYYFWTNNAAGDPLITNPE